MKRITMNGRYRAQALLIVLVVLVVGAILSMAIVSRTMRDRQRVLQERKSDQSLASADAVLDVFATRDISSVLGTSVCAPQVASGGGVCVVTGSDAAGYADLAEVLGVEHIEDAFECPGTVDDVKLTITDRREIKDILLHKDVPFAFTSVGTSGTPYTGCSLTLKFSDISNNIAGVLVTKIYATVDATGQITAYKPYDDDDVTGYCLNTTTSSCGAPWTGNWVVATNNNIVVDTETKTVGSNTYVLRSLRLLPIGADMIVDGDYSAESCRNGFGSALARAEVNCDGVFRAKKMVLPTDSVAPSVFDFLLFSGGGSIQ